MHLILTGATGLVGASALAHILKMPAGQIDRLSIISRKPVPMAEGHPNIHVIHHEAFGEYPPELLEKLKGAEGCIWALGVSQNDVGKEEYIKITKDWPLEAAKAFSTLPTSTETPFRFVYVSGEGATTKPSMLTPFFGRIKGEAESSLLGLMSTHPSLRPFSVRPGYVDAVHHPELAAVLAKSHGTFMKRSMDTVMGPVVRAAYKSGCSPTPELGKMMVELCCGNGEPLTGPGISGEGRTAANIAVRRLGGL